MGIVFGISYDIFALFIAIAGNRIFGAVFDFVMMVLWAFMYFCVMIGYNNGEFRFYHSVITIIAFVLYMISVHSVIQKVLHIISGKLNRFVKIISKKLKFSKKSFRKLLHFHR